MHEWALAESIITSTLEAAQKEKLVHITKITIALGELQQIEHDIFLFALQELIKDYNGKFKNVTFDIKNQRSILQCRSCAHQWKFCETQKNFSKDVAEAIHFIPEVTFVHTRCPKCGSPDFEITKGRGVSIVSIKGERDE